jgi:small-conductance mechanosensitive channel
MTFIIIATLAQLGVQTTSFIAVIGAAGLAIGLALQGLLSNFAAGFLIILFRPFKAGDFIEAAGTAGIVEEIQVFTYIVRIWVKVSEYWDVYFDTIEKVKKTFDAEGISIPFPQRDVHLLEQKALSAT